MNTASFAIAALLAILAFGAAPATQQAPPAVGDKAHDFALDTLDGKTIRLSDLDKTGPLVILQLRGWVGYQCPICTRQVGEFIAHSKELRDAGASVVLVYPGPGGTLKQHASDFIAGKGLPEGFFFVLDPDMKFVNDWHLRWDAPGETAYPSTFVVDRQGTITFAKVSHDHGDRAAPAEVLKGMQTPSSPTPKD